MSARLASSLQISRCKRPYSSASRADVRSLLRTQTQSLLGQIQAALAKRSYGADTQAHLQDSADTLAQALSARLQRTGV